MMVVINNYSFHEEENLFNVYLPLKDFSDYVSSRKMALTF